LSAIGTVYFFNFSTDRTGGTFPGGDGGKKAVRLGTTDVGGFTKNVKPLLKEFDPLNGG